MYVRRRSITTLMLLSIIPLVHLLNINNLDNEKSSKLKIAPLYCVSPRYENITGVCMLSLECKEKNGTIIGSCFNQYLMGACCHDPTYGLNVTSTTTEMTVLSNSSTTIPNTSPNNNTDTNSTTVNSEAIANNASTQITQSLNTTVSPTVAFPSTTTRPFSKNTTVQATTKVKNGTSSIKVSSGVNNKSSVKKRTKPTSSTTKKHNGKIQSSTTEKYTTSSTKANANNKRKTAPNLANKGKKKNSTSASSTNNTIKNHKTNPTTMKNTKKPKRKPTVAPTQATSDLNNKTTAKSAVTFASTMKTSVKMTTATTAKSTTTMMTTEPSTTFEPSTMDVTSKLTTILTSTTTTTTTAPTSISTTTTIPTTTTTPTTTSEVSTTNKVDNGRIEVPENYSGIIDTEETTLMSVSQNIETFNAQTENNENSHEPSNSIEVDSNNSDSFFSDEDESSSSERSYEIEESNATDNNKTTTVPLTFSAIPSSTESVAVSSTTVATTTAAPTVTTTTTTTTTTAKPTQKSKRRKHKKKASSKRSSTTTTIPSTKRTTTPSPETSTKKIKKEKPSKKKGTTEIPTFYITPTRKHSSGSTTDKPSINFSLSEDELETDIDDFINQVVQSLAESLDGSPIDESLNKLQTSSSSKEPSSTKGVDSKLPSLTRKPSRKNSTEKIWDFKKDCGIRPLVKSGRIVGGTPSKFGAWPWHALIKETTWWGIFSKVKCGGVLISHRFVLTAGHCKPTTGGTLTVALGVTNTETDSSANIMNVRRFITHPRFNPKTYDNDIAIVELDRPVEYQPHIVPICMPNSNEVFEGKKAIVTGMGLLRHDGERPLNLHEVDVPILENEDCQQMFAASGNPKPIRDSFICAGYAHGRKDSCGGDSGGGLQLQRASGQWVLAGTVSHGIKCALPNQPGVYMRMTYYKPWINRVIAMASKGRHEFFRPNPAMLGHPKTPASEGMLSDFILRLLKMIGRFWSSGRIPD